MTSRQSDDWRRRTLLRGLGAVLVTGNGSALATGRSTSSSHGGNHVVQDGGQVMSINSPSGVPVTYGFEVTGTVAKSDHVPPGLPHDTATVDSDDEVADGVVRGLTNGGVDSYRYTGALTSFESTNCDEANVWIDDQPVDACRLPDAGGTRERLLAINSPSDVAVAYEVTVSGDISKSTHVPPGLPHDSATRDDDDVIRGVTADGWTRGGVDSYAFTGEITGFRATNCGEANVWVDDEPRDACALPSGPPDGAESIDSPTTVDAPGEYVLAADLTAGSRDVCVDVTADDVTLHGQGHGIAGDEDGVGVRISGSGVTVSNLTLADFDTCVLSDGATDSTLRGLSIDNFGAHGGYGVAVADAESVTVEWSDITGPTGVSVTGSTDVTVADTRVTGAALGVVVQGSRAVAVRENDVGTAGSEALAVDATDVTVRGNRFGAPAIVVTAAGDGNAFENNRIDGGPDVAFSVRNASDNRLRGNTVRGGVSGIDLSGVTASVLRENVVESVDADGVALSDSHRNELVGNRVADAGGRGIYVSGSDANRIVRNTVCETSGLEIAVDGDGSGNVVRGNDRSCE